MARILVIEDDLMVSRLLQEYLSNEGYQVNTATLAKDGFALALKTPPDLIFLDVMLPDATGFQMVRRFKENPYTKEIPVIMMTGAARSPNQQAMGKNMGADDYILKPFNVIQVGERVRELLGDKAQTPPPVEVPEPEPEPAPEATYPEPVSEAAVTPPPARIHPPIVLRPAETPIQEEDFPPVETEEVFVGDSEEEPASETQEEPEAELQAEPEPETQPQPEPELPIHVKPKARPAAPRPQPKPLTRSIFGSRRPSAQPSMAPISVAPPAKPVRAVPRSSQPAASALMAWFLFGIHLSLALTQTTMAAETANVVGRAMLSVALGWVMVWGLLVAICAVLKLDIDDVRAILRIVGWAAIPIVLRSFVGVVSAWVPELAAFNTSSLVQQTGIAYWIRPFDVFEMSSGLILGLALRRQPGSTAAKSIVSVVILGIAWSLWAVGVFRSF